MINPRLAWIIGIIGLSLSLGACSKSSSDVIVFDAELGFVHASPGAPNVDVAVDGNLVLQNVPYGVSSNYVKLDAGNRVIEVFATGTTTPLVSQLIDADSGKRYSFIVYDLPGNLQALVIEGQGDVNLDSGKSGVRVIHGSTEAGPVDVFVTAPNTDLAGATPAITDFQLGDLTPYLELDATDVQIRLTETGTLDVLYDSGVITLQEGRASSIIAIDATMKKAPISLLILDDRQPQDRIEITDARSPIRLFHAISDGPAVDLLISGSPVNTGVVFDSSGGYNLSPAGTREVLVRDNGSPGEVFRGVKDIPRTEEITLFAVGSLNDPAEQDVILAVDAPDEPASGQGLLRVLHASVLAGSVDVYVTAPMADISMLDPTLADFEFKTLTDYLPLVAGNYDVTVTAAGSKTPAIGPIPITITEGDILTAIALDPVNLMGNPTLSVIVDGGF